MARKSKRKTKGAGWELINNNRRYQAPPQKSEAPEDQRIRIKEEKRAKGKVVTIARGFKLSDDDLKVLGKSLKSTCGSGGKVQQTNGPNDPAFIEVQGRHSEKLHELLSAQGYKVQ